MNLVECHSGSAFGERPLAFQWQGQRFVVAEILAEGRTPHFKWFRVITTQKQVFELSFHEETDTWQVQQV